MNILITRDRHPETCDQVAELCRRFRAGESGQIAIAMPNMTNTDVVRLAVTDMYRRICDRPAEADGASA